MKRTTVAGALALSVLAAGSVSAAEPGQAAVRSFRDCADCPEMIILPAGTFVLGTPGAAAGSDAAAAEGQATVIRIARPFAIGRFEVTRGEFARFVADSGYEPRSGCRSWDDALYRFNDDAGRGWQNPGRPAVPEAEHPVTCVSWADARAYVQWLARRTRESYRLPSETEWEYAARAGSTALRPWGDDPQDGCDAANTYDLMAAAAYRLGWPDAGCSDGFADVAPVGQLGANGFGLHDMIGNVAEWTEDCATSSYVGRPRDGRAWTWLGGCQRHVVRGGAWIDPPERARSARRDDAGEGDRADFLGFRVALDLDERSLRGEGR